jgi:hypothetical protein
VVRGPRAVGLMGFDAATIELLLNAPRMGVRLDRVLTIGRQRMFVTESRLRTLLSAHPESAIPPSAAPALLAEAQGYAEPFLRKLGAGEVDSLDVSEYESATILHDMNQPLPEAYHGRFSLVMDGGSLEHVFHYTTALKNCMEAVAPGGHFLTVTPANNLLGHGFYQISPELFFRALDPVNGFEICRALVYEQPWNGSWYEVADPKQVHTRVELTNRRQTYLAVCARRIASVPIFAQTPQQSDYTVLWDHSDGPPSAAGVSWKQRLPGWVGNLYRRLHPFRPPYFQKRKGPVD